MDYQQIRAILTEHFKTILEQRKAKINAEGSLSLDQAVREQIKIDRITQEIEVDRAVNYNQGWNIGTDEEIEKLVEKLSLGIAKGSPLFEKVRVEYLKATRSTVEKILDYSKGFDSYDLGTEAPVPPPTTLEAITSTAKLMDIYNLYEQEKLTLKHWTEKTARNSRSQIELLAEYLGENPFMELTKKQTANVRTMLVSIPKQSRSNPKYKKMTITDLISLDHKDGMAERNINKHLATYSGLYGWAITRDEVHSNFFKGLITKKKAGEAARDEFSIEQIKTIRAALLSVGKNYKDHHKWATLIAMYTGARLNEIAQLEVADIVNVTDTATNEDVLCIHITNEVKGDPKNIKDIKTFNSVRYVPIHASLIELGFKEYVEEIRRANHTRLFPELSYDQNNGYGRNIGRWFSQFFLTGLGMKTDKLSFHSLRHSVITCLLRADVQEPIVQSIVGHASVGVTQKSYNKGYTASQQANAIAKLPY